MIDPETSRGFRVVTHRAVPALLLTFFLYLIGWSAVYFGGGIEVETPELVDFDMFRIVGRMVWEGRLADAYTAELMFAAQREIAGTDSFMPWTYPPPFDLLIAPLALLPPGIAYLTFILPAFAAYLWALRRLAGATFGLVLLAVAPAAFINILIGQNGFLTGALAGLFALGALHGRPRAGLPLGLMVIKPHLAIGLAVAVTAGRRWGIFVVAGLTTVGACIVATPLLGPEVWSAFLHGAGEAGEFLREGQYPLFRMTSIYAALHTFGVPPGLALAAQGALALAAVSGIACAALAGWPAKRLIGAAMLGTVLVSPYNYDYDLTLLGVAAALLLPELLRVARPAEGAAILALAWVATGWGAFSALVLNADVEKTHDEMLAGEPFLSLGGVAMLGLALLVVVLLRRLHLAEGRGESDPPTTSVRTLAGGPAE